MALSPLLRQRQSSRAIALPRSASSFSPVGEPFVQIINYEGDIVADIEAWMRSQHLTDCGFHYNVVTILGAQSSGKSSLVNALFGCQFQVMDHMLGHSQTTKGIWLGRDAASAAAYHHHHRHHHHHQKQSHSASDGGGAGASGGGPTTTSSSSSTSSSGTITTTTTGATPDSSTETASKTNAHKPMSVSSSPTSSLLSPSPSSSSSSSCLPSSSSSSSSSCSSAAADNSAEKNANNNKASSSSSQQYPPPPPLSPLSPQSSSSSSSSITPCLVIDVEGIDSRERGEDRQTFEYRSALLALALADCVIINTWYQSLGNFTSSGYGLLRTVLEVNLELFAQEKNTPKTILLFAVRDWAACMTPLETVRQKIEKEYVEKIWRDIQKPAGLETSSPYDLFNLRVYGFAHKFMDPKHFAEDVEALREEWTQKLRPRQYSRGIPADGFPHYAASIWEVVKKQSHLNIPSQREMLATYRCQEIKAVVLAAQATAAAAAHATLQQHPPSVSELVSTLQQLGNAALAKYMEQASRYQEDTCMKVRHELLEGLAVTLQPLVDALLTRKRDALNHQFVHLLSRRFGQSQLQQQAGGRQENDMGEEKPPSQLLAAWTGFNTTCEALINETTAEFVATATACNVQLQDGTQLHFSADLILDGLQQAMRRDVEATRQQQQAQLTLYVQRTCRARFAGLGDTLTSREFSTAKFWEASRERAASAAAECEDIYAGAAVGLAASLVIPHHHSLSPSSDHHSQQKQKQGNQQQQTHKTGNSSSSSSCSYSSSYKSYGGSHSSTDAEGEEAAVNAADASGTSSPSRLEMRDGGVGAEVETISGRERQKNKRRIIIDRKEIVKEQQTREEIVRRSFQRHARLQALLQLRQHMEALASSLHTTIVDRFQTFFTFDENDQPRQWDLLSPDNLQQLFVEAKDQALSLIPALSRMQLGVVSLSSPRLVSLSSTTTTTTSAVPGGEGGSGGGRPGGRGGGGGGIASTSSSSRLVGGSAGHQEENDRQPNEEAEKKEQEEEEEDDDEDEEEQDGIGVVEREEIPQKFYAPLLDDVQQQALQQRVLRHMQQLCKDAQAIQRGGGKPSASWRSIPLWGYLLLLVLGWDELAAVLAFFWGSGWLLLMVLPCVVFVIISAAAGVVGGGGVAGAAQGMRSATAHMQYVVLLLKAFIVPLLRQFLMHILRFLEPPRPPVTTGGFARDVLSPDPSKTQRMVVAPVDVQQGMTTGSSSSASAPAAAAAPVARSDEPKTGGGNNFHTQKQQQQQQHRNRSGVQQQPPTATATPRSTHFHS